ncbi:hypothetical protein BKA81DRAFT_362460 [Phyllosticta paracitricarpa]
MSVCGKSWSCCFVVDKEERDGGEMCLKGWVPCGQHSINLHVRNSYHTFALPCR